MSKFSQLIRVTTAGSVDDGKSTLIGRLLLETGSVYTDQLEAVKKASLKRGLDFTDLSLLTDGLAAEREQNITIDVAYRYLTLDGRKIIIADVPGHEQYTRNMVTGASTADLAIILVDANKGILQQTIQHLEISYYLRIPKIIIAINKMDQVSYDKIKFDKISADCERWLGDRPLKQKLPSPIFIPVSAMVGDMIVNRGKNMPWYNGPTLLEILKSTKSAPVSYSFRLPIQLVLKFSSDRRYAGQIAGGEISIGDEVLALPSGKQIKITGIYLGEKKLESAQSGRSVAVSVDQHIDLSRADMLVSVASPPKVSNKFTANICWLNDKSSNGASFILKQATTDTRAMIKIINDQVPGAPIPQGVNVRAEVTTHIPLIYDSYSQNRATGSFILIDEITKNTVAAGMIE